MSYSSQAITFSPDGRTLAAVGLAPDRQGKSFNKRCLALWEVATGKQLWQTDTGKYYPNSITFSPDGALLASTSMSVGEVRLWHAATGKHLHDFARHDDRGISVAFSPDGKTLASNSNDHTVLFWDLTTVPALKNVKPPKRPDAQVEDPPPAPKPLPREVVDSLWADLASDDAAKAFRAVWQLALHPGQALPLLKHHLRPSVAPEPRHLAQLIADLDSSDFNVRRRALAELDQVADMVLPTLRKARDKTESKEVQKRLTELLKAREGPITSGAKLRPLRAVEALEHMGTPEACKLLQDLAGGAPEARLTQDAKLALQRLARRPVARR